MFFVFVLNVVKFFFSVSLLTEFFSLAPGGAPRDITVRALRARELHITWQVGIIQTFLCIYTAYT